MNKDLVIMFDKVLTAVKADLRCKGGWHYGSVGRGTADEWSDYDCVLLVAGDDFETFCTDSKVLISNACDELIMCIPEGFNNDCIKNFMFSVRIGESLHQFDIFIINADRPDDFMVRLHCKGCTHENIFFDRAGQTAAFLGKGCTTDNYIPDTLRTIETYWFHVQMLVKYFKRRDIFKLYKNLHDFIFMAHVDLLLNYYDTLDWGGWESKVKHCVPEEKQRHLLAYFVPADFTALEKAVKEGMAFFEQDAKEICAVKKLAYPEAVSRQVTDYFYREVSTF